MRLSRRPRGPFCDVAPFGSAGVLWGTERNLGPFGHRKDSENLSKDPQEGAGMTDGIRTMSKPAASKKSPAPARRSTTSIKEPVELRAHYSCVLAGYWPSALEIAEHMRAGGSFPVPTAEAHPLNDMIRDGDRVGFEFVMRQRVAKASRR